jgi:anion-transporting  ArsA/GET3 family ATPase
VVDTPPSRNALDFLEAPGVLTRFLDHPVFKLLMMPTRTGFRVLTAASQPLLRAIGRVVGSDVLADTVAFFQAFAGMEPGSATGPRR